VKHLARESEEDIAVREQVKRMNELQKIDSKDMGRIDLDYSSQPEVIEMMVLDSAIPSEAAADDDNFLDISCAVDRDSAADSASDGSPGNLTDNLLLREQADTESEPDTDAGESTPTTRTALENSHTEPEQEAKGLPKLNFDVGSSSSESEAEVLDDDAFLNSIEGEVSMAATADTSVPVGLEVTAEVIDEEPDSGVDEQEDDLFVVEDATLEFSDDENIAVVDVMSEHEEELLEDLGDMDFTISQDAD
jgi:hypothetical protein